MVDRRKVVGFLWSPVCTNSQGTVFAPSRHQLAEYLAAIIHGENENDVLDTDFSQVKDLGIDLSDVGMPFLGCQGNSA
jgi:hypothetical protein